MKKTAIVCSGGGMRCAYTGGFLVGLAERFPNIKPDILIAASGGAGSMAYYLTDQLVEMKNNWTSLLANRSFINIYRFWKIMDIDFAINNVFQDKTNPLLATKLMNSKTDWFIPVTEALSHIPVYFSKKDVTQGIDLFDVIHATIAVPVLYGKTKSIHGNKYIDGCIGAPFYKTLEKAIELGASEILAIDGPHRQNENIDIYSRENVNITLVRNKTIPATRITSSPVILSQTFQIGYQDAMNNMYLEKFFEI